MKVAILSSSAKKIDADYYEIAKEISQDLASKKFDLVFGGCSVSMMGICYEVFRKYNRKIYSFTTEKYTDDIANLQEAKHWIEKTTFDMKKKMFELADVIVALPGGLGTLSEILAFIEEKRSNDKDKPIVIYDEKKDYQLLFEQLLFLEKKGFHQRPMDFISVCHNKKELDQILTNIMKKKEGKENEGTKTNNGKTSQFM